MAPLIVTVPPDSKVKLGIGSPTFNMEYSFVQAVWYRMGVMNQ